MDEQLRYEVDREEPEIDALLNFDDSQGILRATEQCNGSGDCRKLPEAGGTMCPSYRATRNEKDSTRGRANTLREFLTHSERKNNFNHKEVIITPKIIDVFLNLENKPLNLVAVMEIFDAPINIFLDFYQ